MKTLKIIHSGQLYIFTVIILNVDLVKNFPIEENQIEQKFFIINLILSGCLFQF